MGRKAAALRRAVRTRGPSAAGSCLSIDGGTRSVHGARTPATRPNLRHDLAGRPYDVANIGARKLSGASSPSRGVGLSSVRHMERGQAAPHAFRGNPVAAALDSPVRNPPNRSVFQTQYPSTSCAHLPIPCPPAPEPPPHSPSGAVQL